MAKSTPTAEDVPMEPSPDPRERFSDRVANYVRYRPGYPEAISELLAREAGLLAGAKVADVGSGTGISTEIFLRAGAEVFAVEPNAAMRAAAEHQLADFPGFHSIPGGAEATTLPDQSVDLVAAAQAFHWFDPVPTRREFSRILVPGGRVALIWNERQLDTTPFLRDYEALLVEFGTDYEEVRHENVDATLGGFFIGPFTTAEFANDQRLDFDALKGRLLSSSYAPGPSHHRHEAMLAELRRIFDLHEEAGLVELRYTTRVHIGH